MAICLDVCPDLVQDGCHGIFVLLLGIVRKLLHLQHLSLEPLLFGLSLGCWLLRSSMLCMIDLGLL